MMDRPSKIYLQITNTCHMQCKQCYTNCSKLRTGKEFTDEEWKSVFDQLDKNGIVQLYIEGGEPLFRPGFLELASYAAKNMLVWFRTHGNLITAEVAHAIHQAKVGLVAVDIFSPDKETFDYLAGVPDAYERTLEGIKFLQQAGVPVVIICILNNLNINKLDQLVDLAEELGINKVAFFRLYPIGRAKENWKELAPRLEKVMEALRTVRRPMGMNIMASWHPNDGNCCWQNAAITSEGKSIGCPYLREFVDFGDVHEQEFLDTWNHPLYKQLREQKIEHSCSDCADTQGSKGGCRSTAFAFSGKWDAADPFCEVVNGGNVDLTVLPEFLTDPTRKFPLGM